MATTQESATQQAFHWHYAELDDRNFQIRGRTLFFIVVLFAIIVALTILFLYARWICRYRNILIPISHPHAPPHATPRRGLDPALVTQLPITLHRSSSAAEDAECCICLGVIEDGEKVKVLPNCRHCYHSECVDRWLVAQSSCPMCRAPLRVDSDLPTAIIVVTESEQ